MANDLIASLVAHGRGGDLDALLADKKRSTFPEREAIEGMQSVCMKAAAALREQNELIVQAVEAEAQYEAAIRERDERIATLTEQIAPVPRSVVICDLIDRAERAEAEAAKLREALGFYADVRDYKGGWDNDGGGHFDRHGYDILDDEGAVARAALADRAAP